MEAPKTVERRDIWRQPTPVHQLVALIGAARGLADNLRDGAADERARQALGRIDELLDQAIDVTALVSGQWPSSS